ncbi:hypothetical protein F383_30865 [Gossypium arboreum]|uniref:Uncharacterized protein n=1 Tax=Gossypium arboreum TaxID=29729 RepID=A0A0B0N246_GOSAR|nr:hypothetical protein F383_30865 [Gossypium arboreum]
MTETHTPVWTKRGHFKTIFLTPSWF